MARSRVAFAPAAIASLSAAALLLSACASATPRTTEPTASSAPADTEQLELPTSDPIDVASDLEAPWSIAFLGDTALISERDSARILELRGDGSTREIGQAAASVAGGEAGLLGLAVQDTDLFVFSTAGDGGRIERYDITGTPGEYALGEPSTILSELPSARNHNGGRLAFGPDGMLYASVGDAGDPASAQDPEALSGKILRMTADGEVPDDNPFPGSLVYSSGHRNVQGLAWADDGTMFASEFGQDTWDELNIIEAGGNYGWPEVEGIVGADGFTDPVQQWNPDDASPSGIAISGGTIFIAGLKGERLIAVQVSEPSTSLALFAGDYGRLRDVVNAPDGTLWIVTNNTDGRGAPRGGDDRILSVEVGAGREAE